MVKDVLDLGVFMILDEITKRHLRNGKHPRKCRQNLLQKD